MMRGSSPLARGLPTCFTRPGRTGGIIPARAGFTLRCSSPSPTYSDHPRSRGVYGIRLADRHTSPGSSPLARGLREGREPCFDECGIIPARAGFTG